MSVELPRSAEAAPTRGAEGRSRAGSADAAQDGPGAFMTALSEADSAAAEGAAAGPDDGDGAKADDADAPRKPSTSPDAAAPSTSPLPAVDNAMLLAQSALGGRDAAAASGARRGAQAVDAVDAADACSAAASARPVAGAADPVADPAALAASLPAGGAGRQLSAPKPTEIRLQSSDASATATAASATHSTAAASSAATAKGGLPPQPSTGPTPVVASQRAADQVQALPQQAAQPQAETIVLQAAAESAMLWRRSDNVAERTAAPGSAHVASPAHGTAEPSAFLLPVEAASAGASAGHADLGERMVEQVSWWISQKVQNAEIQLDVPGGPPVSVSVQIKGNEAQVAFRSDQPEMRQILNQAMPQLEKMLGSEGLMLAGATVGDHADASGRQPPDDASAAQRALWSARGGIALDAPVASALPRGASAAVLARAGRSLDLYV